MDLDILTSDNEKENIEVYLKQQEKKHKILASYLLKKGLKLFSYNTMSGDLKQMEILTGDALHIKPLGGGKYGYFDPERLKCFIDSNDVHFQALNIGTAKDRVKRFKEGKLKNICNLTKANGMEKILNQFNQTL